MRRMFVSLSSLEKPRPLERFVRTSSPSSTSNRTPRARNSGTSLSASVVLPAPDNPVNHSVKPLLSVINFPLILRAVTSHEWQVASENSQTGPSIEPLVLTWHLPLVTCHYCISAVASLLMQAALYL